VGHKHMTHSNHSLTLTDRTWDEVVGTLHAARLVVATDSVILQLATALGVPSVGLFGATDPDLIYNPRYVRPIQLPNLRCLGCWHRTGKVVHAVTCYRQDHLCMQGITVEMVESAVRDALGSTDHAVRRDLLQKTQQPG